MVGTRHAGGQETEAEPTNLADRARLGEGGAGVDQLERGGRCEEFGQQVLLRLEAGLLGAEVLEPGADLAQVFLHVLQPGVHLLGRQADGRGLDPGLIGLRSRGHPC